MSDFWLAILNLKNAKHLKKTSEEFIPIEWHPKRWWNFCASENEKKENRFLLSNAFNQCHTQEFFEAYWYMYQGWTLMKVLESHHQTDRQTDQRKLWLYLAVFRCQTTKQNYKNN